MILQHTHILSNLNISKVSTWWWLKTRKHQTIHTYPLTNSMLSSMIILLDTQVLFLATNPCSRTNSNSKWCSQLLMSYINLEQPTQVQLHERSTSPPKVCHSILEKFYSETWVKATQQDVNTSRCLDEKWKPHFKLKRWVWPMINCSHLTPKSIYSNIGDFVADHLYMKFSRALFCAFAFVSCMFISPFKKNFI